MAGWESWKLAHTALGREAQWNQPWADTVSVLPDLLLHLRDNFYCLVNKYQVKSPDLQILAPVFLKKFYIPSAKLNMPMGKMYPTGCQVP